MSTYDESLHPRGQAQNAGQFRAKENDAPMGSLAPAQAVVPEDPWGDMPGYPTTDADQELFAAASDYQEVDEILRANRAASLTDGLLRGWAAVERGRQLRREGVQGVPASGDGAREDIFGGAQNDAELRALLDAATEELHGDGEAPRWMALAARSRHNDAAERRRQVLAAVGAVSGPSPFR